MRRRWIPVVSVFALSGCGVERGLEYSLEEDERLTMNIRAARSFPVDVLVIVDGAASMSEWEGTVESNIEAFDHILADEELRADYQLIVQAPAPGERALLDRLEQTVHESLDEASPQYGLLRPYAHLIVIFITDADDASLSAEGEARDVSELVTLLAGLEASKTARTHEPRVFVSVVGGLADGGTPDPDCGQAHPTRLLELVDAFGGREGVASICSGDYQPALRIQTPGLGPNQIVANCFPACVADRSPDTPDLQPDCETVELTAEGDTISLLSCEPDGTLPPGALACVEYLTGDEREPECIEEGANVEPRIRRAPGDSGWYGEYLMTCTIADELAPDCLPD